MWCLKIRRTAVETTIDEFNTQCTKLVQSSDYPAQKYSCKRMVCLPPPRRCWQKYSCKRMVCLPTPRRCWIVILNKSQLVHSKVQLTIQNWNTAILSLFNLIIKQIPKQENTIRSYCLLFLCIKHFNEKLIKSVTHNLDLTLLGGGGLSTWCYYRGVTKWVYKLNEGP